MENEFQKQELLVGVMMETLLVVMGVLKPAKLKKISNALEVTKPQEITAIILNRLRLRLRK